ncbi:unnamed protein product [Ectocarpus sp. 12 AP-2014]
MVEVVDGISLQEVVIPAICFVVCAGFQTWEFLGSHDDPARARTLFKAVRAGWVKDQFMKGTAACNTTRDYIKSAVFMANTAITLATFAVGYAGSIYTNCSDDDDCTPEDWLFVIKLGCLSAVLLVNFFVLTQCTRFAVHFSFCINTRGKFRCISAFIEGVPMSHAMLVNVFEHSHKYFSLGIRLYFGTIPVFAWIFTPWALLAVTPVYVYMVRGLENAGFVKDEIDQVNGRKRATLPPPGSESTADARALSATATAAGGLEEGPSDKNL